MSMGKSTDLEEQYEKIYRYCYFKVHRQELAEDITQETFLKFYERYGHYGNEWTLQYLYRIAHNLCVDEYRKPDIEQLSEEMPENTPQEGYEEELVRKMLIEEALSELEEEEKELLLLRYVNEVPVSALCGIFSISRFALYRRLKGAVNKLKRKLGEEEFV